MFKTEGKFIEVLSIIAELSNTDTPEMILLKGIS